MNVIQKFVVVITEDNLKGKNIKLINEYSHIDITKHLNSSIL